MVASARASASHRSSLASPQRGRASIIHPHVVTLPKNCGHKKVCFRSRHSDQERNADGMILNPAPLWCRRSAARRDFVPSEKLSRARPTKLALRPGDGYIPAPREIVCCCLPYLVLAGHGGGDSSDPRDEDSSFEQRSQSANESDTKPAANSGFATATAFAWTEGCGRLELCRRTRTSNSQQ